MGEYILLIVFFYAYSLLALMNEVLNIRHQQRIENGYPFCLRLA
jgi:hypothetical protein